MTFNHTHIPELNGKRPGTLIHLGAGRCRELDTWRQAGFHHIVLVEADPVRSAELHARIQEGDNITVIDQAVSASDGPGEFNILNYPDASSLREPGRLLELFPGIRIRKRIACQLIAIETLLSELKLDETAFNGLVIETPGEEHALIQALTDSPAVDAISFITVQSATVPLYKGAQASHAINALLAKADFNSIATEAGDDPIRPILQFERDLAALERKRVSQELAKTKKDRDALREKLTQTEAHSESVQRKLKESEQKLSDIQAERDAQKSRVKELQAELQGLKPLPDQLKVARSESDELKKQVADLEAKAAELKKAWEERSQLKRKLEEKESKFADAKVRADRLEKKLDEARAENKRLSDQLATQPAMTDELKKLFDEQSSKLDKVAETQSEAIDGLEARFIAQLSSEMELSTRQVEDYISLSSVWSQGEPLPQLNGWAICSDLAMHLVRELYDKPYDLVVEFGSGRSTLLMARALAEKNSQLLKDGGVNQSGTSYRLTRQAETEFLASDGAEKGAGLLAQNPRRANSRGELVPPLIAFEHLVSCRASTVEALSKAGLNSVAKVVLSPLQDYIDKDGGSYLYYDCDEELARVSENLVSDSRRILVLVDGPPGKTGRYARYPALSKILRYFSTDQICIVMDDASRSDESEVLKAWEKELQRRGLPYTRKNLNYRKGAAVVRVNGA